MRWCRSSRTGARLADLFLEWAVRHAQHSLGRYFDNAKVLFFSGLANPKLAMSMSEYTQNLLFADPLLQLGVPKLLTSIDALGLYGSGAHYVVDWAPPRVLPGALLLEPRALDKKLLGNCRDHSVLLAAMLRQRGCPARARCGFATYFLPDHYEDHWVTEYWNRGQNRWVLVDAQLDKFQAETLGIDFDPLDVPRDRLLVAGQAWQMCRSGAADPEKFGIFDMHGLDFVRGNLVRDLAALNKVELLPWDCWGIILDEQIDSPDGLSLLDRVASLTTGAELDLDAVRSTYADPRLRMDGKLLSYVDGGMAQIVVPVS